MPTITQPATPLNPIASFIAPIGGIAALGDGGYMVIRPASFTSNPHTLVDVIRWRMASSFGEQPIAKSGMLGATGSRRTGHSYVWEAEIVLDLRVEAELLLRDTLFGVVPFGSKGQLLAAEIYFKLGTPTAPSTVHPRYYWLPRAKIDSFSPMLEAGEKKRVRYKVAGCANCHCLLLPDQGNPADATTIAGAYQAYLTANPDA